MSHLAAEHFNYGLRAYYFALAAMTWFLNGWLFMGAATWVVFVLYWREFRSDALESIKRAVEPTQYLSEWHRNTRCVCFGTTPQPRSPSSQRGIFFANGVGERRVRRTASSSTIVSEDQNSIMSKTFTCGTCCVLPPNRAATPSWNAPLSGKSGLLHLNDLAAVLDAPANGDMLTLPPKAKLEIVPPSCDRCRRPADRSADDLALPSASEIASRVRRRELSPFEVARAFVERADAQRSLDAFITLRPETVLREARQLETRLQSGEDLGPLAGVPVAVKDLMQVKGYPLTCGTKALPGDESHSDAEVVAKLRAAGALIVGTTNLHELAYGVTSANAHFGHVVIRQRRGTCPAARAGVRRRRCGGLGGHRRRHRHRRIDPHSRRVLRDRRIQGHARGSEPRRRMAAGRHRWTTSARSPALWPMPRSPSR